MDESSPRYKPELRGGVSQGPSLPLCPHPSAVHARLWHVGDATHGGGRSPPNLIARLRRASGPSASASVDRVRGAGIVGGVPVSPCPGGVPTGVEPGRGPTDDDIGGGFAAAPRGLASERRRSRSIAFVALHPSSLSLSPFRPTSSSPGGLAAAARSRSRPQSQSRSVPSSHSGWRSRPPTRARRAPLACTAAGWTPAACAWKSCDRDTSGQAAVGRLGLAAGLCAAELDPRLPGEAWPALHEASTSRTPASPWLKLTPWEGTSGGYGGGRSESRLRPLLPAPSASAGDTTASPSGQVTLLPAPATRAGDSPAWLSGEVASPREATPPASGPGWGNGSLCSAADGISGAPFGARLAPTARLGSPPALSLLGGDGVLSQATQSG